MMVVISRFGNASHVIGMGPLDLIVENNMNRDIVQHVMSRGWIYQQVNEPKHTSRHVTDWCPMKRISVTE
jgi:hypothetical protein